MLLTLIVTHGKLDIDNLHTECSKAWDVVVLWDYPDTLVPIEYDYIQFENKGYDFGKIRQYLGKYSAQWERYDTIVITNDTISPIWSMEDLFDFCKNSTKPRWGATDAYTSLGELRDVYGRHVQSFFLFLKWEAKKTYINAMLWAKLEADKFRGVALYEQWISRLLEQQFGEPDVYVPISRMMKKYGRHRISPLYDRYGLDGEEQPNWELNWSFKHPKAYVDEGLPFVKNTCFQYQYTPYEIYRVLPPTRIVQWDNDIFVYCTCEYDPEWYNVSVTGGTYVHLHINQANQRYNVDKVGDNTIKITVPGYGREVGALRYLMWVIDLSKYDTLTYLNDSVRVFGELGNYDVEWWDILYYSDAVNYVGSKYIHYGESYFYRVNNIKHWMAYIEKIWIRSDKDFAILKYEIGMSNALTWNAKHKVGECTELYHDYDILDKKWDICNQSYVNTDIALKLTHHNNNHKHLHRNNIKKIASILYSASQWQKQT